MNHFPWLYYNLAQGCFYVKNKDVGATIARDAQIHEYK